MESNKIKLVSKNLSARRYAIGDIHGCYKTLFTLIENQIKPSKNDQIFFLGDYIDRGTNSAGVLDYIIEKQENGYSFYPVKGNHEQDLIDLEQEYDGECFRYYTEKIFKTKNLLTTDHKIKTKYKTFINNLPYLIILDEFIIVHAGIDFKSDIPFENYKAMLEIRNFQNDIIASDGKTIIHGHTPTNLDIITDSVKNQQKKICLDNGCVYTKKHKVYDYLKLGNLVALNLDTYKLEIQSNIDNPRTF